MTDAQEGQIARAYRKAEQARRNWRRLFTGPGKRNWWRKRMWAALYADREDVGWWLEERASSFDTKM